MVAAGVDASPAGRSHHAGPDAGGDRVAVGRKRRGVAGAAAVPGSGGAGADGSKRAGAGRVLPGVAGGCGGADLGVWAAGGAWRWARDERVEDGSGERVREKSEG